MKTLIVAPHPDDELLGCGGTLLRRRESGGTIAWLVMTGLDEEHGWSAQRIRTRAAEIERVRQGLSIESSRLFQLGFPTTKLDTLPAGELIQAVSGVFRDFQPEELLLPHRGDIHSDHRVAFDAVAACTKWFRYPSVKRVLAYETLSETEFGLDPQGAFYPNVFVDIGKYIERKLELLNIYSSEMGAYPFPRSEEAVRALAVRRGSQAGFRHAEAFQLLRERT